jgi:hypothetical protein
MPCQARIDSDIIVGMSLTRREYLQTVAGAIAGGVSILDAEGTVQPGIPGRYRGRVAGVTHSKCILNGKFQAKPIGDMLDRGMCELTGAPNPAEAWRQFFEPADVVGIKVNPVGQPHVCSSAELLHSIVHALRGAGIKPGNIKVFERYRENIVKSPYIKWLPQGVQLAYAAPAYDPVQQDIAGYDPECYAELPFTLPGYDVGDKAACRSYAAKFISRDITKLINLPVLKSHNAAGVTLALKNLSHGLVNNVSRSHDGPDLRLTEFIPAVVGIPAIRQKTVLNILDGTKGLFHGGPGITAYMARHFVWEHNTIYFATDPVALDVIGRKAIEEQRMKNQLWPLGESRSDDIWRSPHRQPQHIESAGTAGLGEWDLSKIDFKSIQLG